jgi:glycosyltransferase involved in cell wall biosynthesis
MAVKYSDGERPLAGIDRLPDKTAPPVIIVTIFRETGSTGVHTHIQQVRGYLEQCGTAVTLVTPFAWGWPLYYPVFGSRLALHRFSGPASVVWYRHWHEMFLLKALRRKLARVGDCTVYAQGPLEGRAALRARQGPHQRVVMAVHFRTSQADEYAEPGRELKRDGMVFRAIRQLEREVIPRVDGIVFVSEWARRALLSWLPEAAAVPSDVICNFVTPLSREPGQELLGDLVTVGRLDAPKNHRFLLDVLAEARRAGRTLTLDVFGEGPLRQDLERRISSLGLAGQVRIHGYQDDVRRFLPAYRAYVHASYAETSSLAIIEAMAAGLPVVAADIGPISELYDGGVEGRFWPLDNHAQAAVTLLDLLDSEPTRIKAARAAKERFDREFSVNVVGPRMRSFLSPAARHGAAGGKPKAD